ncbi:hypothetical protein [Myxococcus sp. SDU36]|uniref:hypothetical protein n=1 Tax=Myxococcus sp. SDU36 TaxID=2831967 RepID=UPI00254333BD|nr:hypothetical protein [Myxococcus sp. SDU36]WIG94953.1 hypothetical protein KGD87_31335 [Myxococcus sp. SDU36]
MGVVYLLLYIAGGGLLTLGVSHFLDDVMAGEPLWDAGRLVAIGAFLVCLAGVLHAFVARRRDPGGAPAALPRMRARSFALAGALWAVPILVGWVQFERFVDPIRMMPQLTVLGGLFLVFCVCTHVMANLRARVVATTMAVACVGLPLGLLGAALPIRHFNHHLSDVVTLLMDPITREDRSVTSRCDGVDMAPAPLNPHENLLALATAIGDARPIDVEAEIAAGRMRQIEDGTYVFVNPDGTESGLAGAKAFDQQLDEAEAADKRQSAEAQAARVAAWERELRQRKLGGRLFTRAPAD